MMKHRRGLDRNNTWRSLGCRTIPLEHWSILFFSSDSDLRTIKELSSMTSTSSLILPRALASDVSNMMVKTPCLQLKPSSGAVLSRLCRSVDVTGIRLQMSCPSYSCIPTMNNTRTASCPGPLGNALSPDLVLLLYVLYVLVFVIFLYLLVSGVGCGL